MVTIYILTIYVRKHNNIVIGTEPRIVVISWDDMGMA